MKFDFPKSLDVKEAFELKKEKEALLRKQKEHVTVQMLKRNISAVLTVDSVLCEGGSVSVVVDTETLTEYQDVVQECIKQLKDAGWYASLDHGTSDQDPVSIVISMQK
jgi:hypothetical protein